MAMTFKDADFAPNLTMREKVAELTKPQDCQGCHSVINPLGFSLENYDAVGRFRTDENGRPIDVLSDYLTEDGKTVLGSVTSPGISPYAITVGALRTQGTVDRSDDEVAPWSSKGPGACGRSPRPRAAVTGRPSPSTG